MIVYTDNKNLARKYFAENKWYSCNIGFQNKQIRPLLKEIYSVEDIFTAEIDNNNDLWRYVILVSNAKKSHYDLLIDLAQKINLPDGIICFADSGNNFHGFHNRSWSAETGNIHLSAFLKPNHAIKNFSIGFIVLSAVSVIQTIDNIAGLKNRASIKWVNDILLDNAKVSGVLAHTRAQSELIKDVVLGIGINVNSKPEIEKTIFVPSVISLNDVAKLDDTQFPMIINNLIDNLTINYKAILENNFHQLLDFYINRSMVIGKKVSIWSDERDKNERINSGIVEKIGDNLELYLENETEPIRNGRLSID